MLVEFLRNIMTKWSTKISLPAGNVETEAISIKCGIFQGDSLSALWFCLAMNPLSNMLNNTTYGFQLKNKGRNVLKISHLAYIDDFKLYTSSTQQLQNMLHSVKIFSDDIKMSFGLDKCRVINIQRGKMINDTDGTFIFQTMEEDDVYKYLGIMQSRDINSREVKKTVTSIFKKRLHDILKSNITGKNTVRAINTFAISVLIYSFGIVNWSDTDLHNLQRKIRTTMTKHKFHHPISCVERTTIPRKNGGKGLLDIRMLYYNQIKSLRNYFHTKSLESPLHAAITTVDSYTPLKLSDENYHYPEDILTNIEKERRWSQKKIHSKHYYALQEPHVDKETSNKWLTVGDIYGETEGFMFAIQDGVIPTRNYLKHVIKDPAITSDICRKCNRATENIEHITSSCQILAPVQYLKRHNDIAKIIHQELAVKYGFIQMREPYYKYTPESYLENQWSKLYYDRTQITTLYTAHNRPDIVLYDKEKRSCTLIDIAVPANVNVQKTYSEKIRKYENLAYQIKCDKHQQNVTIIPLLISCNGIVPKSLTEGLKKLELHEKIAYPIIKSVILNTCHTVRSFLNTSM